ncbi:CPCC family cysteine-rich protein [Streptomyces sp. NPDC058572]|uniref:CPCC family cysteine-rich protein n=1 Tax=Streptomyces sp. NPDC058572 TaxID=3346546 RepID=UPI003659A944
MTDPISGRKLPCLCCGFLTVSRRAWYEICPVCGWEDNDQVSGDPDEYVGGPNHVTLSEARRNFAAFGASEERRRNHVRPPLPSEHPE